MTDIRDDAERALLVRLRQRDEQAFRELVGRHQAVVRAYAAGILGDPHEAEDAAQECLPAGLPPPRRVPGRRARSRSWLLRICRNHCLDRLRTRPSVTLVEFEDEVVEGASDTTTAGAALRVDRERLVTAIVALPEALQQAIVLRELRGLSYEEVAAGLDVPVGTVRSRLSAGRALLREALGRP